MKRRSNKNIALSLLLSLIGLLGCQQHQPEQQHSTSAVATGYTCPMPEDSVFSDKPGICPKCGMDLVPYHQSHTTDGKEPTQNTAAIKLQTIVPIEKSIETTIAAKGYWDYDPQSLMVLSARFDGRIERLYVKYNYQKVSKGQRIMDIYSPELVTAQQEYISLLNSDAQPSLAEAARQKLLFLGMDLAHIQQIRKARRANAVISLFAPASGHIHQMESPAELSLSKGQYEGMERKGTLLTWREGMYIKKGDKLLNIIDISNLWAILKVYPQDLSKIQVGKEVSLVSELLPNHPIKAKIGFIEPIQEVNSNFVNVRVPVKQPSTPYPIGSLLNATWSYASPKGLWLPATAIVYLGPDNAVVFKKVGHDFLPQKVTAGHKLNNEIQIVKGLNTKDTIALYPTYLIDSDNFINP